MKKRIIAAILIVILSNGMAFAKDKNVKNDSQNIIIKEETKTPVKGTIEHVELSFEQAFELMMANNNGIKACLEDIKVKQYEKKAAIGTYFPKLNVGTSYVHFGDQITVNTPPVHLGASTVNVPSILIQDKNLWTTNFGAVWNIFTGGKKLALNSAARAKLEGSNNNYKELTNNLTVALVEKYYGLIFFQDVAKAKKQVLDNNKQHWEDAKKLEKAGMIPKSERLHAEVAYNQALRDYKSATRDIDIVKEGLIALIKDENIDINGIDIAPTSKLFIYNNDFKKLEEYKKLALQNNAELKQSEVKKKLAQANYRSKAANYSPTVSAFAYDIIGASELSSQVPRFAVGATANFLLFDGLTRYNELQAAKHLKKAADYEALNTKYKVESSVTSNYEQLMKYKEQYELTKASIESANEALRTAKLAFQEGYGTSLAVTDAESALSNVKIQRLSSMYYYDIYLTKLLSTNDNAEDILNYIKNSTTESL